MALSRTSLRSLWLTDAETLARGAERAGAAPDAVILDCVGCRDLGGGSLASLVDVARSLAPVVLAWLSAPAAGRFEVELAAVLPGRPDAVILSDCADGRDVQHGGVKLGVAEAALGWTAGATAIIAAPGAAGFLALDSFRGASARLQGFAQERPATAGEAGGPSAPGEPDVLRTLLLLAARSAGVAAYDVAPTGGTATIRRRGCGGLITRDAAAIGAINAALSADA